MVVFRLYVGGACIPNPGGVACYAFRAKKGNEEVYSESGIATKPFSDEASSNVAEYTALIKGLKWLIGKEEGCVEIRADSETMIKQLNGQMRVWSFRLLPLVQEAMKLMVRMESVDLTIVPKEKNRKTTEMAEQALKQIVSEDKKIARQMEPFLATKKQMAFMRFLKIAVPKIVFKREASRLIDEAKEKKEREKR